MFGSGVLTGFTVTITTTVQAIILQDLVRVLRAFYVAVVGITILRTAALHLEEITTPIS